MKKIGIIGGMSYESSAHYYAGINREIGRRAGGHTSADMVLRSVNFEPYCQMMDEGKWIAIKDELAAEARHLVDKDTGDGCDFVAIATNTIHKAAGKAEQILTCYGKPLVHIGDCIADACKAAGCKRVALLGTKVTMTDDFLKERLRQNGLEVVGDFDESEINELNRIIFDELCHGEVKDESQIAFLNMILCADCRDIDNGGGGFDAVILGCTELAMLLENTSEIFFATDSKHKHHFCFIDSTQAHIDKLVEMCLEE